VVDMYEYYSVETGNRLNKDDVMRAAMRSPRFRGSYSSQAPMWELYVGHAPKQSAERLGDDFLKREALSNLTVRGNRIYVASGLPMKEYYKVLTIERKLDGSLAEWQAFDRISILVSDNLGPNYNETIGWMKLERVLFVNDEAAIPDYTPQQVMVVQAYFEIKPNWSLQLWREIGFRGDKRPPTILHTHETRRETLEQSLDLVTATSMLAPTLAKLCSLDGRDIDLAASLGSSFFTNPPENLMDLLV
jgi:hypothetical protein